MSGMDSLAETQSQPTIADRRLRLITYLVTATLFMETLDGTVIATALPQMANSLHVAPTDLNIGMSAYILALGIFIPLSAWVADRFSVQKVFACAIAGFTLASLLCGLAGNVEMFVLLRVLQGASGAMMVPVGRIVVLRYTPHSRLMAAIANMVWPALVAPVLGPPLGGFITTHASWRWIFYLNLPLGLIALAAAIALIPKDPAGNSRPFDWPGFLLCGCGTFLLMLGLERLATGFGLISILMVVAGIALLAATIRHFRHASHPMLNLTPLAVPTYRASVLGGSVFRMAVGSVPFLLPLMLQAGFGYSAFQAGLLMLALFVGNLGMKTITTRLLRHFGYRRILVWNGSLCILIIAACALMRENTPVLLMIPLLVVNGMTRSMQFSALATIAFADLPPEARSNANGLADTVSQVSTAAGITISALFIRFTELVLDGNALLSQGLQFRLAFLGMAALALVGLINVSRLPQGAGDHFVAR